MNVTGIIVILPLGFIIVVHVNLNEKYEFKVAQLEANAAQTLDLATHSEKYRV